MNANEVCPGMLADNAMNANEVCQGMLADNAYADVSCPDADPNATLFEYRL